MCNKICKPQKIILAGKEIVLRNPKKTDVPSYLKFIDSLVDEDAPILVNEKITLKEEKEWLDDKLKSIRDNKSHCITAFHNKEVVGNVDLKRGRWRNSHVGTIGMSVKKSFRGIGLGKLLMKKAVEIAKKDSKIKILTLDVLKGNDIAKKFYEKTGFKLVARLPKRIYYKGKYVDEYVLDFPLGKI